MKIEEIFEKLEKEVIKYLTTSCDKYEIQFDSYFTANSLRNNIEKLNKRNIILSFLQNKKRIPFIYKIHKEFLFEHQLIKIPSMKILLFYIKNKSICSINIQKSIFDIIDFKEYFDKQKIVKDIKNNYEELNVLEKLRLTNFFDRM